ncbi:hypothetical protein ACJJTC_001754, partial [Scirpophaga incertulas]
DWKSEKLVEYCTAPCTVTLRCNHQCTGSCARCHQGRLHASCVQKCHATLICGHQCEEPCNQVCPPCKKRCEVNCTHSKCNKTCGAPCTPCQEKCKARCEHQACNRLCGQQCSRRPCDAPCPRKLPCRHPCRGLCGEPCPDICKLCRPNDFPMDFLGDHFPDDTRFIQLQDCPHVLAVEDADNLMLGDTEIVSIRSCPFCRKPIINTNRYKDLVNRMYINEINPIKERVYGTRKEIVKKLIESEDAIIQFEKDYSISPTNTDLLSVVIELKYILRKQKNISLLQIEMHLICLNILNHIGEYYRDFLKNTLTQLQEEFLSEIKLICHYLVQNIRKISQQQQEDINNEMKRLHYIIQLSRLISHPSYVTIETTPDVQKIVTEARMEIFSYKRFNQNATITILKKLEEQIKVKVINQERKMIVRAMGFKQGHWFKCPNGHFYCIADCGGAMVISKCNECGAKIGGQNHTLLSDNSLASEIDGSKFAAWSEEYNNMANFDFRV